MLAPHEYDQYPAIRNWVNNKEHTLGDLFAMAKRMGLEVSSPVIQSAVQDSGINVADEYEGAKPSRLSGLPLIGGWFQQSEAVQRIFRTRSANMIQPTPRSNSKDMINVSTKEARASHAARRQADYRECLPECLRLADLPD